MAYNVEKLTKLKSLKQLAEKISQVDWSKVKEEKQDPVGQRFDLTI